MRKIRSYFVEGEIVIHINYLESERDLILESTLVNKEKSKIAFVLRNKLLQNAKNLLKYSGSKDIIGPVQQEERYYKMYEGALAKKP